MNIWLHEVVSTAYNGGNCSHELFPTHYVNYHHLGFHAEGLKAEGGGEGVEKGMLETKKKIDASPKQVYSKTLFYP